MFFHQEVGIFLKKSAPFFEWFIKYLQSFELSFKKELSANTKYQKI